MRDVALSSRADNVFFGNCHQKLKVVPVFSLTGRLFFLMVKKLVKSGDKTEKEKLWKANGESSNIYHTPSTLLNYSQNSPENLGMLACYNWWKFVIGWKIYISYHGDIKRKVVHPLRHFQHEQISPRGQKSFETYKVVCNSYTFCLWNSTIECVQLT